MNQIMRFVLTGGMALILGGCAPDQNADGSIQASLFVSNQSVAVESIPISVELDGIEIVNADFPAIGPNGGIPQHYWVRYDFVMTAGEHYLTASTEMNEGATASETLSISDLGEVVYLLLDFNGTSAATGDLRLRVVDTEPTFQ